MSKSATFIGKIIKGRMTIPEEVREGLKVWEDDQVKVTLEKTEKEAIDNIEAIAMIAISTTQIEWTELLKKISSITGEDVDALENNTRVYVKIKELFKESKEGKIYTYTPKKEAEAAEKVTE